MTDQWAKLALPFPESEVKQRPGRGNMTFSYIDARAVMQRLDDVLTPSGWDFTSSVIPGIDSDVVRGELTIGGVVRVDYGYPNSDHDEEPIKAASSDALKRCAVMFGVGRHLYSDNGSGRATPPPARPSAPLRVVVEEDPTRDAPAPWEASTGRTDDGGTCPDHGQPWTLKPAGISNKTGHEYDAFWKCDGKYDDGSFCKKKPPKAWAARHEQ